MGAWCQELPCWVADNRFQVKKYFYKSKCLGRIGGGLLQERAEIPRCKSRFSKLCNQAVMDLRQGLGVVLLAQPSLCYFIGSLREGGHYADDKHHQCVKEGLQCGFQHRKWQV